MFNEFGLVFKDMGLLFQETGEFNDKRAELFDKMGSRDGRTGDWQDFIEAEFEQFYQVFGIFFDTLFNLFMCVIEIFKMREYLAAQVAVDRTISDA